VTGSNPSTSSTKNCSVRLLSFVVAPSSTPLDAAAVLILPCAFEESSILPLICTIYMYVEATFVSDTST
jgi:hypothetical protein